LESAGMTGIGIIIAFVLFTALLNLLIFSGSAQWALEAPIFLKMFYFLGYYPAFILAAYRIDVSLMIIISSITSIFVCFFVFIMDYSIVLFILLIISGSA